MISGFPPGVNNLPPMARNSFLFATTSFEAMCQWPIVTPISLNGAGCAVAVPAVSADANNKTTNVCVFTDTSLRAGFLPRLTEFGASCFVHGIPAYDGPHDSDVLDLLGVDRVRVFCEHDEVGQLSGRDGAFDGLLLRRVRAVDCIHADRVLHADLLIGAPDLPVPALARDHS